MGYAYEWMCGYGYRVRIWLIRGGGRTSWLQTALSIVARARQLYSGMANHTNGSCRHAGRVGVRVGVEARVRVRVGIEVRIGVRVRV